MSLKWGHEPTKCVLCGRENGRRAANRAHTPARYRRGAMSNARYIVAPTVTVLGQMKVRGLCPCGPMRSHASTNAPCPPSTTQIRLTGASKGHQLLKKKADALSLRFRCVRERHT